MYSTKRFILAQHNIVCQVNHIQYYVHILGGLPCYMSAVFLVLAMYLM